MQFFDLAGKRIEIEFEKREEGYQANMQHLNVGVFLLQVQDGVSVHRIKVVKK